MNIRSASLFRTLSVVAVATMALICAGSSMAESSVASPRIDGRMDEVSAAQQQQHKRQVRRHARPPGASSYAYRPPVYPVPRSGRAADPSIAPNGLPYPRPNYLGDCVIDEGYGRWSACSNR